VEKVRELLTKIHWALIQPGEKIFHIFEDYNEALICMAEQDERYDSDPDQAFNDGWDIISI